jgi:hypothetical protein
MTALPLNDLSARGLVVALLAPHWSRTNHEVGWITRQVAGALACSARVEVVSPEGAAPGITSDSVFSVHQLGSPIEPSAELRRDLIAIGSVGDSPLDALPSTTALGRLANRDLIAPWSGASGVLATLSPDLIVIAGHQSVGALAAVDDYSGEVPVVVLAQGSELRSLAFPPFLPLFDRARSVLTITQAERNAVIDGYGRPESVYRLGAPLAANPIAFSEPDSSVGHDDYLLVLADGDIEDQETSGLSQLVPSRFPGITVAITRPDTFCVWRRGRMTEHPPIERSSDLARLMAWARATVDLRPGRLFARRSIESLLYGTPIVVPHDSRAREHAERGRGGLWFANPAELTWCIEGLLDPAAGPTLGAQGRSYAEAEYGSTDRFIDRVLEACGLSPASVTA